MQYYAKLTDFHRHLQGFVLLSLGVDEATIIDILTKRTNAQRQQIKSAYHQSTGKVKSVLKDQCQQPSCVYIILKLM